MSDDAHFIENALEFIYSHNLKDNIIANYLRGPPEDRGFMFYNWETDNLLSDNDKAAFAVMQSYILDGGYDSGSSFGCMQRAIQARVIEYLQTPTNTDDEYLFSEGK